MRHSRQFSQRWLGPVAAAAALTLFGCIGTVGQGSGSGGSGPGSGTGGSGSGGTTGGGSGGAGGVDTPCAGNSDPRLVVASQRVLRLTSVEVINTIRYLIDGTIADKIVNDGQFALVSDINRKFPPLSGEDTSITDSSAQSLDYVGQTVGKYVLDNFAAVTKCTSATDTCAQNWLNALAAKAYRRALTADEQTRFGNLYTNLRGLDRNCRHVTGSIQQATQHSVYALLISPQVQWRWEVGNTSNMSSSPPGVYLTDSELASNLSFFLTDSPPDDMLLTEAKNGTLRTNLSKQVDRLLGTQGAKDWLRTMMETFFLLNLLPATPVDRDKWPDLTNDVLADMGTESTKFMNWALWQGNLVDLANSRTTFLNTRLANTIYKVPVPSGATDTNFVQTNLPSDQRAGVLTSAGFITSRARSDKGGIVPRGLAVKATMLCLITDPPPADIGAAVDAAKKAAETQTAQEQVAFRAGIPLCASCHAQFDQYGLVLDYYDNIGRYRTTDDLGMPVNGNTKLPDVLGGDDVTSAVDLADKVAKSPAFVNCMAKSVMQLAMTDLGSPVDLPLPPQHSGCAAADLVTRFNGSSAKTFTELVKQVVASPAFVLRKVAQ